MKVLRSTLDEQRRLANHEPSVITTQICLDQGLDLNRLRYIKELIKSGNITDGKG